MHGLADGIYAQAVTLSEYIRGKDFWLDAQCFFWLSARTRQGQNELTETLLYHPSKYLSIGGRHGQLSANSLEQTISHTIQTDKMKFISAVTAFTLLNVAMAAPLSAEQAPEKRQFEFPPEPSGSATPTFPGGFVRPGLGFPAAPSGFVKRQFEFPEPSGFPDFELPAFAAPSGFAKRQFEFPSPSGFPGFEGPPFDRPAAPSGFAKRQVEFPSPSGFPGFGRPPFAAPSGFVKRQFSFPEPSGSTFPSPPFPFPESSGFPVPAFEKRQFPFPEPSGSAFPTAPFPRLTPPSSFTPPATPTPTPTAA